ncbi:hypothetical protein [Nocardioides sp. B-3]|uniref:hypothetical protein n=1 Tax=Nocardioides sp. B-3 TaxID=2895565 RepID=UPI0021528312|nr:hypothetical protein [Nocardioides sp. B-3]UUZ59156.1 hypothetical protein LP418_25045 [Nocardioides sp. B-3]
MSTLREALDALTTIATTAGIDPAVARAEGESLAATVAEPARGCVRRLVRRDRTRHRRGLHHSRVARAPLPRGPDAGHGVARVVGVGPRCGVRPGAVGRRAGRQLPR